MRGRSASTQWQIVRLLISLFMFAHDLPHLEFGLERFRPGSSFVNDSCPLFKTELFEKWSGFMCSGGSIQTYQDLLHHDIENSRPVINAEELTQFLISMDPTEVTTETSENSRT
jgi:hypothetical protein